MRLYMQEQQLIRERERMVQSYHLFNLFPIPPDIVVFEWIDHVLAIFLLDTGNRANSCREQGTSRVSQFGIALPPGQDIIRGRGDSFQGHC